MAYNYSQYGGVLVERQKKVLTITLNSPETLNAFTGPMHTSMSRIWDAMRGSMGWPGDLPAARCGRSAGPSRPSISRCVSWHIR